MSLSSEITRLQNAKSALKTSIEAKGVTVSDSSLISDYSAYVDQIPTGGGGGGNEDLINLIERDITTLNIPYGTTKIGNYIFYNCIKLTSVTIPNSVTKIDSQAFMSCSGLTSLTIPDSVTSIGNQAFMSCSGLTSLEIPNSVTEIGGSAFYYCTGLTSLTIPDSVTSIGNKAFDGTVWYNNQLNGLVYAGKVAYKYKGTMSDNTSITIKDGTLGISEYAFYNCSKLTSVTISNSVTSIGGYAFYYCTGLTSVTIQATTPPSLGSSAFNNTNNCPIYVPAESVDAYKTATNWSSLANRIQAIVA